MESQDLLHVIETYEKSIGIDADKRFVRVLKDKPELEAVIEPYAKRCAYFLRFGQELDKAIPVDKKEPEIPSRDLLKVCDTPPLFRALGMKQLPITYTQRHAWLAMKGDDIQGVHGNENVHHIPRETLKKLPALLGNPVLVADSHRSDSLVVFLEAVDSQDSPLMAVLRPAQKGLYQGNYIDMHLMPSVYGKEETERFVSKLVESGNVVYVNKSGLENLERLSGVQFPRSYSSSSPELNTILKQPSFLVNSSNSPDVAVGYQIGPHTAFRPSPPPHEPPAPAPGIEGRDIGE